jgi:hypothetical protein
VIRLGALLVVMTLVGLPVGSLVCELTCASAIAHEHAGSDSAPAGCHDDVPVDDGGLVTGSLRQCHELPDVPSSVGTASVVSAAASMALVRSPHIELAMPPAPRPFLISAPGLRPPDSALRTTQLRI